MTTQINIRLNEHLLQEIDTLAHMLHVPRSEWLRMKLAEAVKKDLLKPTFPTVNHRFLMGFN